MHNALADFVAACKAHRDGDSLSMCMIHISMDWQHDNYSEMEILEYVHDALDNRSTACTDARDSDS